VSSIASAAIYYITESAWKSFLVGGGTYFLYEPDYVPLNADAFPVMYIFMLLRRRIASLDKIFHVLGFNPFYSDELQRRRKMCSMEMKLCKECTEEVIPFETFSLFKFTPNDVAGDRAIVYFHGGGFVLGSVPYYRRFLSNMAVNQKCIVFSPDYPKAPENPYPASQLGCLEAVKFIFNNAGEQNIDPKKIIFTGDSAGGMLAVNMWHRLLKSGFEHIPCALSLVYPCLGYSSNVPSCSRNSNRPPLTKEVLAFFYLCHINESRDAFKYDLIRRNVHLDHKNIPESQRNLADPRKWLPENEFNDWCFDEVDDTHINFTPQETQFRQRLLELVKSPNFCILFIPDEDLKHIPQTDIFISEHDILKNDGQIFNARINALGKKSNLTIMNGAFHACFVMSGQFGLFPANWFKKTSKYCDDYFNSLFLHGNC